MHPLAQRVLGPSFHLVRSDGVGELAVFPRQNDVLNEQRQIDEQEQQRRVLKEADKRDVGIDDGELDRAVEKESLVAHGCERHHHIGEKQEKREPAAPGRVAGPIGLVQEVLGVLGLRGHRHSGGFRQA